MALVHAIEKHQRQLDDLSSQIEEHAAHCQACEEQAYWMCPTGDQLTNKLDELIYERKLAVEAINSANVERWCWHSQKYRYTP